ncbi:ankyrin-1-like [Triticum urartu]|uniref:ankyrin-1-like n=1 Tax=Triticum urartu TaxID=4572 RepID=UPI002044C8A7|nr:ankyrin-1-like [Triticum urartu]
MEMEMEAMGKQQREEALLRAAADGNLRLLKEMARWMGSGGEGEAAILGTVEDGVGDRALHLAAGSGRLEVCRYLVEDLRLDVNQLNFIGDTPLYHSVLYGRDAAARYLLDHGADPLAGKVHSPLYAAAKEGHCEIVKLLLSRGINVDLDSLQGTPLHAAAISKDHDIIKILLEHHANPNKVFGLGYTPLSWAIRAFEPMPREPLECVKLLVKAGADLNFIDFNGGSYAMLAVKSGFPGIMRFLLDAGANPNIPDECGNTPIEVAASKGSRDMVEMLFPLTSPVSTLPNWSIDGIISHVKHFGLKPMDKQKCAKIRTELKQKASEAFKEGKYYVASEMYTGAMAFDPSPDDCATILANRSLSTLRGGNGRAALSDATMCRMARPLWPKACYREGAALMLLKKYERACEAFADGLKLDPTNGDLANALREAQEAAKNARRREK